MPSTPPPIGPLGDLPSEDMRAALHRMADWVADYRETLASRRIVPTVAPGEIAAAIGGPLPADATAVGSLLDEIDALVLPGIVHWGHPAFLGYFGSTSNGPALLGEIAAAALNVSAMTWRTSPAATEMETVVLQWIRELVGLPADYMGIVYDTASVAVLHALCTARETALTRVRAEGLAGRAEIPRLRVYASTQAHSSLVKAAIVLGIGEGNVVHIGTDTLHRMDVIELQRAVETDRAAGMLPLAVVATVGTTTSAAVDPLREIAALCERERMWLHADAAYGGAVGALPEARALLDGLELADSVVVNPHKWLFVPLDFSALYTRRPEAMRAVFSLVPEYLRGDASGSGSEGGPDGRGAAMDYMDYGIQLGRRFRALKAWMMLRAFGRNGIESRIREHCRLAAVLGARIESAPDFELATPVAMSVVCFRFAPSGHGAEALDALNARIVAEVNAAGRGYLTHSVLAGRTVMRVGFGNLATTQAHVEVVWGEVVRAARRLAEG